MLLVANLHLSSHPTKEISINFDFYKVCNGNFVGATDFYGRFLW